MPKYKYSNGSLPPNNYLKSEDPLLPYVSNGCIIGRNIRISGFTSNKKTNDKFKEIKAGGKISFLGIFSIGGDGKSTTHVKTKDIEFESNPPAIIIKAPCILGYYISAFPAFPPFTSTVK